MVELLENNKKGFLSVRENKNRLSDQFLDTRMGEMKHKARGGGED